MRWVVCCAHLLEQACHSFRYSLAEERLECLTALATQIVRLQSIDGTFPTKAGEDKHSILHLSCYQQWEKHTNEMCTGFATSVCGSIWAQASVR